MPIPVKQLVADMDQMLKDACVEAGADYDELVAKMAEILGMGDEE
jgi:ElaB/YqjD/DUF883 family membrane-anchored ribosome-binding protein